MGLSPWDVLSKLHYRALGLGENELIGKPLETLLVLKFSGSQSCLKLPTPNPERIKPIETLHL